MTDTIEKLECRIEREHEKEALGFTGDWADIVVALLTALKDSERKLESRRSGYKVAVKAVKMCREDKARLRKAIEDAPKLMQFMDSWICEMMDNETICAALREMKEWDALCAFQDMIREQKTKMRAALEDKQ
jgi:hypothetical protein